MNYIKLYIGIFIAFVGLIIAIDKRGKVAKVFDKYLSFRIRSRKYIYDHYAIFFILLLAIPLLVIYIIAQFK